MSDGEYFGRWIMSVPEMAPGEKRVVGYADYIDSPGSIAHFYFGVNVMNAGYSDTVNGSIAIVVTAPNGEEFRMDSNIDFQGEMYEDNNHVVDGFGTVWIQAFDNASIEDYENDSYSGTESSRFFAIVFPDQITDNGFNTSPRPSDDPAYNGRWLFSIENNSDADYTPIYVVHALNLEEDVGERYLAVGLVGTTAQNPSDDSSALSGDLWIQSGANQNDGVWLSTYDCRAVTLGVDKLYTDPRDMAEQSLSDISKAINTVSMYRADAGAKQNRLEHTLSNVENTAENLSAAESRIRDVDMAKEMAEYVKQDILTQSATSILAQANQQPQAVLQLLG